MAQAPFKIREWVSNISDLYALLVFVREPEYSNAQTLCVSSYFVSRSYDWRCIFIASKDCCVAFRMSFEQVEDQLRGIPFKKLSYPKLYDKALLEPKTTVKKYLPFVTLCSKSKVGNCEDDVVDCVDGVKSRSTNTV